MIGSKVYLLGGKTAQGLSSTVYTATINPDSTIGTWSETTPLATAVAGGQVVVSGLRIYLIGGVTNSGVSTAIYSAEISPDGEIGQWVHTESLPDGVEMPQAAVTSSRIYLLGGQSSEPKDTVVCRDFTGGANDYMALISSKSTITSPTFRLPDYSDVEGSGLYYYIRY